MKTDYDVIIVGAGIAGLTAAKILKAANKKILLIESSDGVGGRVRTDHKDGFLLDRGFQVLLTSYPEAMEFLDYQKLNLKHFKPGALILDNQQTYKIGDPFREPLLLLQTLFSPIGNLKDKLLLLKLKISLASTSIKQIFERKERTTFQYLQEYGFSEKFIEKFFRPFFSGIFLENRLETSSRMFEFLFKMFGSGSAAVPANGMGMISNQLAEGLDKSEILLNEKVETFDQNTAITTNGKKYSANAIIIATTAVNIPSPYQKNSITTPKSNTTLYFSALNKTDFIDRITLNTNSSELINNIAFMDHIAPNYAPKGMSLISVSIKEIEMHIELNLEEKVKTELLRYYPNAKDWKHLATYRIPYALPTDKHVINDTTSDKIKIAEHYFICGDFTLNGSINAAMKSGKLAAQEVLKSNLLKS